MDTNGRPTRRRFLSSVGVAVGAASAGCATAPPAASERTLTVRVDNRTDSAERASVSVEDAEGMVVERVDDEKTPPGVSRSFERSDYGESRYTVRVRGGGWATSGLWDAGRCRNFVFTTTLESGDSGPSVAAGAACADE